MADTTITGGTTSANILPANSGQDLGSDTQRWDLFAGDSDVSGALTVGGAASFSAATSIQNLGGIRFAAQFASIQDAIDDLPATGGIVILPVGTTDVSSTILVNKSNVKLIGHGQDGYADAGDAPTPNTILNWAGASGGTVIEFATANGANKIVRGGGLEGVAIYGNSSAAIGLSVKSVCHARFDNIFILNTTEAGLKLDVVATAGDARDPQYNQFENIEIRQTDGGATAADCISLNGDATANSSLNTFVNLRLRYTNGNGITLNNSDNNRWMGITTTRSVGGTGKGLYLTGSGSVNTAAREETFFAVDLGAGGVTQDGTATGNAIFGYHRGNGAGDPVISAGKLAYTDDGLVPSGWYCPNAMRVGNTLVGARTTDSNLVFQTKTAGAGYFQFQDGDGVAAVTLSAQYGSGEFTGEVSSKSLSVNRKLAVDESGVITKYNNVATDGAGIASIQKVVNLVNQTAAITTTNILASVPAGLYRLSYTHELSQAATTSSATQLTIGWNNGYSALTKTGTNLTGNTLATTDSGEFILHTAAATDITYAATYSSTGATPMTFDLTLRLEKL